MHYLSLLQHPELFQGEKQLKKNKYYFEGWYFKHVIEEESISFIPGIHINQGKLSAFIQIITNDNSSYITYPFEDFHYYHNPFIIQIGNNYFTKKGIKIDIQDINNNVSIKGEIEYGNLSPLKRKLFSPNIMGPFTYAPFMECNHAILSMKHSLHGILKYNHKTFVLDEGIGYIEKDWGTSFPKEYLWCQTNSFPKATTSLFLSIAHIPFKTFDFEGFICIFLLDGKEYKFTTYSKSKIDKYLVNQDNIFVELSNSSHSLLIECTNIEGHNLKAPVNGDMKKTIKETLCATVKTTLKKKDNKQIIYSDFSKTSGLEIVNSDS